MALKPSMPAYDESMSYMRLSERLYAERFNGAVLLHFRNGIPREVEIPKAPTKIRLTEVVE